MDELAKSYETRTKEFFELREEHEALRARLVQVEGNLSVAEDALLRHGYRKSCSIAACNCGDQWSHGGSARERLTEIGEAFDSAGIDRNGKTLLQATNETIARAEKAEQFREAVIDALVVSCIYVEEHDTNPRKAINDLICWEQKIALDPLVSSDARALIERAVAGCAEDCAIQVAAREKAEQENARLREALATAVRFYDERVLIGGSMECVHWLKAARTALGGE